jgi:hypothetical protein
MTTPRSLYGKMLLDHQGRMPDVLDAYTDEQVGQMLNEMINSWEALSVFNCVARTGLITGYDHIELWRKRPNSDVDYENAQRYPIQAAVCADLSASEETVSQECFIEWGNIHGARPISQASRDVIECNLRALHAQMLRLREVLTAQVKLVDRILVGDIVSEEGIN